MTREHLTLIRCRDLEGASPVGPGTVPTRTLAAMARTLRYGVQGRESVLISDRMATFLADLLDERAALATETR